MPVGNLVWPPCFGNTRCWISPEEEWTPLPEGTAAILGSGPADDWLRGALEPLVDYLLGFDKFWIASTSNGASAVAVLDALRVLGHPVQLLRPAERASLWALEDSGRLSEEQQEVRWPMKINLVSCTEEGLGAGLSAVLIGPLKSLSFEEAYHLVRLTGLGASFLGYVPLGSQHCVVVLVGDASCWLVAARLPMVTVKISVSVLEWDHVKDMKTEEE